VETVEGQEGQRKKDPRARPRPLYDVPYMFEAREFLRKKLIGKKVMNSCVILRYVSKNMSCLIGFKFVSECELHL